MANNTADNPAPRLTQLWQLPALLLGVMLFGVGLYLARPADHGEQWAQVLDQVQAMITAGRYDQAVTSLDNLAAQLPTAPEPLQQRFHLLVGDAIYLGQKSKGWSRPDNHESVIKAYETARELGAELDTPRRQRIALSLAATGQTKRALELLAELGEAGAGDRQEILKGLILAAMRRGDAGHKEASELIDRLLAEPRVTPANQVWAVARQAEMSMAQGQVDSVVDMLLRRITRLQDEPGAPLAELMVMLGRAYLADGDPKYAEQWFMQARQQLDEGDPLNAAALVGMGRIRFAEDNPAEAVEFFSDAADRFSTTDWFPEALLGRADSAARLGDLDKAVADYAELVKLVNTDAVAAPLRQRLGKSLDTQHDLRFGQGDYEGALRFVDLSRKLAGGRKVPPPILLKEAMAHEQIARERLGLGDGETETEQTWQKLDATTRGEAMRHMMAAAEAYRAHADAVTRDDNAAYGQSLWRAADYFDRVGDYQSAVAAFREFIGARPDDARTLTATYRLAQAHQADGQFDEAIALYNRLLEQNPKSPEAYASLVPLARCYLAKGDAHMAEAERVLRSVVTNHPALRPESQEYREALIELGQLYYRRGGEGDYESAIERLNEVIARYGGDQSPIEHAQLQFQLADAYRKSAQQLDAKLAGSLPPSRRAEFAAERVRRLEKAGESFEAVIIALEKADAAKLDELGRLYLRNSYFYRADCAYALGRYDGPGGAIAFYDKAIQRYEKDPASLVAMIQIVNSYGEMKQWDKARAANERAKVRLRAIPDEAFDDPSLPMSREAWQRWLDWSTELAGAQESVSAQEP